MNTYGINSLEVSYTYRDNSTSPASSIIYIEGYDKNYNIINFNMNPATASRRLNSQNQDFKSLFEYIFYEK